MQTIGDLRRPQLIQRQIQLVNERMALRTESREILGLVGATVFSVLEVMELHPTFIRATLAIGKSKGAAPLISGVNGVSFRCRHFLCLHRIFPWAF